MGTKKDFNQEIARVAYDLFEKRGGIHRNDLEDWLRAEKIVMQRYAGKTAKTSAPKAKKPASKKTSSAGTKKAKKK